MDDAIVVLSRKGLFKKSIRAMEISSREHARKLWPFVEPGPSRQMVTWVRASFYENGGLQRRSHFRLLPIQRTLDLRIRFDEEERDRVSQAGESKKHSQAKELIAAELSRRLNQRLGLQWAFNDEGSSDYPLVGNLLLGADEVSVEQTLTTPFESTFRLDIALLGAGPQDSRMIVGALEIEFTHEFDGRKAMIGRSLGFPLISIDVTDMELEEITPAWAAAVLSDTTRNDEKGRRFTYVYLHDLLYPLYVQIPEFINPEKRHQYIIFSDEATLQKLAGWLRKLAELLEYPKNTVSISLVNATSDQAQKMLESAGAIVGPDWREFNERQCLRVTLPLSRGPADLQENRFYMQMARLILMHGHAAVGYLYANGYHNDDPEEDIWIANRLDADSKKWLPHRVLPKRLSDPVERLIAIVEELENQRRAGGNSDTPFPAAN